MIIVTESARSSSTGDAMGDIRSIMPSGRNFQNCISFLRIWVVRVRRLFVDRVYSPTRKRKKNAITTRSAKARSFGSRAAPSCCMMFSNTPTGNASWGLGAGSAFR
jgi:hypothetical protein